MSQLYTTTFICDNCGVKLIANGGAIGMMDDDTPRWWYVRFPLDDGPDTESVDFCSAACLVKWVTAHEPGGDDGN